MIHVIVADDQALIRGALSVLIDLEDDMRVVAQAADGREAIAAVEAYTAENSRGDQASKAASTLVVIMDVEMPVMDGISAAAALKERGANARVLMVTTFGRPGYVQRALDAGAVGFVVKDAPAEQLLEAIRRPKGCARSILRSRSMRSRKVKVRSVRAKLKFCALLKAGGPWRMWPRSSCCRRGRCATT